MYSISFRPRLGACVRARVRSLLPSALVDQGDVRSTPPISPRTPSHLLVADRPKLMIGTLYRGHADDPATQKCIMRCTIEAT